MNVFEVHEKIIADYAKYIRSFISISDPDIQKAVDAELKSGKLWPEPLLQFNPAFQSAGKVSDLSRDGIIHRDISDIFKGYTLHQHQLDAIKLGTSGKDFVVTSGTGSGKSLTYIGTIFSHLLNNPGTKGVVAVVVYPMNALINSQTEEFTRYQKNYREATGREFPISFGQYTGQEEEGKREQMRTNPPQILLTNYMMLELLLTRIQERPIRDAIYNNLRYLVFDELHTYRGRQGADVAMLIRRIRAKCRAEVSCIGTSATMVSGGTIEQQRQKVAGVASTLFGKKFDESQIVNETLARSLDHSAGLPGPSELGESIRQGLTPNTDINALRQHPLVRWLELEAALESKEGTFVRRRPRSVGDLAEQLSGLTGETPAVCGDAIKNALLWISQVNASLMAGGNHNTVLPYRWHQFISQTGSVYTTLGQGADRLITLEPGAFSSGETGRKPLFVNVFSRTTGHPFICVSIGRSKLEPREFRNNVEDEDNDREDGYLIVGEDVWDPETDLDLLPDSWFKNSSTRRALPEYERRFPEPVFFDDDGNYSDKPKYKYRGWLMKAPLLFDPTSGTIFDSKTRDGTKLAKLGTEGRSTSTTITTVSILNQLREAGYSTRDQKLLSFTDNRQDAALQAGHFNDFVRVVQFRTAIHKALRNATGNRLTFTNLGQAIFGALDLRFNEYANREDEPETGAAIRKYQETFQSFLLYRALADLRRSWRIVLPNLEQCALLQVDYEDLDDVCSDESLWSGVPVLEGLSLAARKEFIGNILDFYRLEFALHSVNFLEYAKMKENEKIFRERLRSPWTLDDDEELQVPRVVRFEPLAKSSHLPSVSMGPNSAVGKYIKQFVRDNSMDSTFVSGSAYKEFVLTLMNKLSGADFLQKLPAKTDAGHQTTVFRLKVDKIIWRLGDGQTVRLDSVKRRSFKGVAPRPNEYFHDLYSGAFNTEKRLVAADHTGQLTTELRQEREDRFKCDWVIDGTKTPDEARIRRNAISALFCSPTMELGVDIGGLSVVHMRNVPPSAANYVQRSGRAGRSGQGALVFTYCSSYSPHDRHYFHNQADMVAGVVQPPKLDLCNQELLHSHLNALAISEIGLPGLEAGVGHAPSLSAMIDMDNHEKLPLSSKTKDSLKLSQSAFDEVRAAFKRSVYDFEPELSKRGSSWYSDSFVETRLNGIERCLDDSMVRWRKLYKSAKSMLTRATQKIEGGTLKADSVDYKNMVSQQRQSTRQLDLLRNDRGKFSTDLSEFYPYRYLASEGFLPGYNFTRLPIRIFLPGEGNGGEFLSRPRAIALREFGPRNVIYHNGRKYRVDQVVIQDAEAAIMEAKISSKAGYFLTGDDRNREICPFTGVNLGDAANKEHLVNLIEMAECRATEVDRITCEEEERVSRGFEVDTYFTVDGGFDRIRLALAKVDETTLLNLRYIPAARLVYLNRKWRSVRFEGFPLGMTSGVWSTSAPDPDKAKEPHKSVMLWTNTVADALFIEPVQPLGLTPDGVVTLEHALKRAIEIEFQVEPNEIGVFAVGSKSAPNILLYEAAEGSLGILSRFTDAPDTLHTVVRRAKELCRFDDPDYTAPASYDDLLSYYNQRDHKIINRFEIRDALEKLLTCSIEIQSNSAHRSYEEHFQSLLPALDINSQLERKFLDFLHEKGLRLPDSAQMRSSDVYTQPDFYYEPRIWVFIDGSVHDRPEVQEDDRRKRDALRAAGDEVVVYNYRNDLEQFVLGRPDIFRKVK